MAEIFGILGPKVAIGASAAALVSALVIMSVAVLPAVFFALIVVVGNRERRPRSRNR